MKKNFLYLLLTGIVFVSYGLFFPNITGAEVNINIGVNAPLPQVIIPAPPVVILIPGTYAYFVPDVGADIIFYHGQWWRPHNNNWYKARSYNGPWVYVVTKSVPPVILNLPPGYRHVPPGHERIPYGQLKKNWGKWEREKHWDKQEKREFKHEEKERHKEEKWERKHDDDRGGGKGKGGKHRGDD